MREEPRWSDPRPVADLRGEDLGEEGVVFAASGYRYRTTGKKLGHGGMGNVYLLERRPEAGGPIESCVGKAFHSEYLYQLRTDEATRRDHAEVLANLDRIARLDHPNLLPTYLSVDIDGNHLSVTPRKAQTLGQAVAAGSLAPRRRVELLIDALRGLACLHEDRLLHRDVTVRNILVDEEIRSATLFDFDLSLDLASAEGHTYRSRYRGRIFGSPGYSVAPEVLDAALMDSPISERLDVYAVGGALFALFSDELPYGKNEDMWSLLLRISEGIVVGGHSRIAYPERVPRPIRPVLERCMERDPADRYPSVDLVIADLEAGLGELEGAAEKASEAAGRVSRTLTYGDPGARLRSVHEDRRDSSLTLGLIEVIDRALATHGYQVRRAIGRVKGYPIFMAAPDPELVARQSFPDANTYPKIVTAIDLNAVPDRQQAVELWLSRYLPILREARQGLLTPLHRVTYDDDHRMLFLLSEYVDDARFGTDLEGHALTLEEIFGLGYLATKQVRRLHSRGLAHNNVGAASLLLKGIKERRVVHPAMVGLVAPSFDEDAKVADVRRLAGLVLSWLRAERVEEAHASARSRLDETRAHLAMIAFDERVPPPGLDGLLEIIADGLSTVDYNFGVLRESDGDLDAYALLLVSHSLYGRLWE